MGTEYLSYVKSISTYALKFFGYIISVLANVRLSEEHISKIVEFSIKTPKFSIDKV